jgi:hypothetical protein
VIGKGSAQRGIPRLLHTAMMAEFSEEFWSVLHSLFHWLPHLRPKCRPTCLSTSACQKACSVFFPLTRRNVFRAPLRQPSSEVGFKPQCCRPIFSSAVSVADRFCDCEGQRWQTRTRELARGFRVPGWGHEYWFLVGPLGKKLDHHPPHYFYKTK